MGAIVLVALLAVGGVIAQNNANDILQNVGESLESIGGALPSSGTARTTPRPTAVPTPVPAVTFDPIPLSGKGNAVPRFTIPATAVGLADISHRGSSNFAVWSVGEDGSEQELLVNTIGSYSGTVLFDTQLHSVAFKVEADGAWTITVKPLSSAFHWDQRQAVTGTGDDVVILDPATSGLTTVAITHRGSSNFAVWAWGDSADLLVNEIGSYTGESLLGSGTILLQINADGAWSVSPPK